MIGWLQEVCDILGQLAGDSPFVYECFWDKSGHNPGAREDEEVFLNGRSSLDAWLDLEILLIYFAYQKAEVLGGAL